MDHVMTEDELREEEFNNELQEMEEEEEGEEEGYGDMTSETGLNYSSESLPLPDEYNIDSTIPIVHNSSSDTQFQSDITSSLPHNSLTSTNDPNLASSSISQPLYNPYNSPSNPSALPPQPPQGARRGRKRGRARGSGYHARGRKIQPSKYIPRGRRRFIGRGRWGVGLSGRVAGSGTIQSTYSGTSNEQINASPSQLNYGIPERSLHNQPINTKSEFVNNNDLYNRSNDGSIEDFQQKYFMQNLPQTIDGIPIKSDDYQNIYLNRNDNKHPSQINYNFNYQNPPRVHINYQQYASPLTSAPHLNKFANFNSNFPKNTSSYITATSLNSSSADLKSMQTKKAPLHNEYQNHHHHHHPKTTQHQIASLHHNPSPFHQKIEFINGTAIPLIPSQLAGSSGIKNGYPPFYALSASSSVNTQQNSNQKRVKKLKNGDIVKFSSLYLIPGKPTKWKQVWKNVGHLKLKIWEAIPDSSDDLFTSMQSIMAAGGAITSGIRKSSRTTKAAASPN